MCWARAALGQCFCVFICFFPPLSLCCSRSRVFPVSAGPFFSQQSSFLAHHSVVGAAALWQHHLCPRAQLAVPLPPPQPRCHLHPLLPVLPLPWGRAVALDLLRAGAGKLRRCPCAGTAWHGRADEPRQLLAAGPGSRGEPPPPAPCLEALAGMLEASEVAAWRGAPDQLASCPIPNQ